MSNRISYTQASTSSDPEKPKTADLWLKLLDGVASGKKLPEKNILLLGGNTESQREFLEALSSEDGRKPQERGGSKQPPVANSFALGYTYQDVLDTDHEDILARLSLYLLADPSPAFTDLLKPLLTPETIPNTLIVVLLDWSQPWFWLRQLRDWIRLLRSVLTQLDEECNTKMVEVMNDWHDRGKGGNSLDGMIKSNGADDVNLPSGPGEWDAGLGLPLCVVCQNSDKVEVLEKERAWKEEEFDFVLQFMRTVLLKHGASLIYTTPSVTSPIQALIHTSLGITSLLKKQQILKHNVIDRDKVAVPPNWDSWGKIRVLREGFDVEAVSRGWSVDIEDADANDNDDDDTEVEESKFTQGAISIFENTIRDPSLDGLQANTSSSLEVSSLVPQVFLAGQLEILDKIRHEASGVRGSERGEERERDEEGRVSEHIGPVQFNMGGIQVDADDMLQRLKDRQTYASPEPTTPAGLASPSEGKAQNEALASFFAGLMKRGGGGSTSGSPKPIGGA